MSKSLKNFVTVREALETYSARQIRFLFLLHRYHEPMEYSANAMSAAVDLERRFASFDSNLAARLADAAAADAAAAVGAAPPHEHKWGAEERVLQAAFAEKRATVHAALLNAVDTPAALKALEQLVRAANTFVAEVPDARRGRTLLQRVGRYYARVLKCFGAIESGTALEKLADGREVGAAAAGGAAGTDPQSLATALSTFRDDVRRRAVEAAKAGGEGAGSAKEMLALCDSLRDDVLPSLGVKVEDQPSGVARCNLDDPKVLLADQAKKREAAAKAAAEKEGKAKAAAEAKAAEAARAAVPPSQMFAAEHDALFGREQGQYGALDADGVPIADGAGEPLSKSAIKKLKKMLEKQKKLHEKVKA